MTLPSSLPVDGDLDSCAAYLRAVAYRYARRKGLSRDDAEDCAQECVFRVLRAHPALLSADAPRRDLGPWLRGCARHSVIDHLRRTCREAEAQALLNEPEVGGGDLFDVEAPDDTYLPEACLEREEFRRQIRRAIDRLKDTPHFYILERFYLGFSIEEIAGYHSETTNQVYKALKSALRDLGRMLQEDALTQADLRRAFDAPSQVLVSLARKKNRKSVDTVG